MLALPWPLPIVARQASTSRTATCWSWGLQLFTCSRWQRHIAMHRISDAWAGHAKSSPLSRAAGTRPFLGSRRWWQQLAVRAALHADGLPTPERRILQDRWVDAAYRPHALQDQ